MEKNGKTIGDVTDIELIIDGYSGLTKEMREKNLVKRMLADLAIENES